MGAKRGAWGDAEKAYIKKNYKTATAVEMAKVLNRNADSIQAWVEKHTVPDKEPETRQEREHVLQVSLNEELHNTLNWKKLKEEFTHDELEYYQEQYVALIAQFKDDVVATEQQQVRKAITLDILMRRNLVARRHLLDDIDRLEKLQAGSARRYADQKAGMTESDRQLREEYLLNLETQLSACRAAEQSKTKEFSDLDTRHQKLMEALKATRDQRITRLDTAKTSFLEILKDLQDAERSEAEGRQMDLMRRAGEREHERLSRPHVYGDKNEDQPMLSAETVKELDAANATEKDA
jgi:hypothetical protein